MDARVKKSIEVLNFIISDLGYENPKKFSESLGLDRPERIYKIFRGDNAISRNLAGLINSRYPKYSVDFLLTGKSKDNSSMSQTSPISTTSDYTGYYYPDVSASAGLESALTNNELTKVPITIPGWGENLHFINVYGDSMYPKYCSGEVIGVKEIDAKYLNFGYAYVVIMNDGEVYLKYIQKGKDNEHWMLASENPKYDPKEFHISLIRKVYIIKGVITKVTM